MKIAILARPSAASVLEKPVRAKGAFSVLEEAARACFGAACVLGIAALACPVPPVRSERLFEPASAPPPVWHLLKKASSLLFEIDIRDC